jgi:TonB family protein
MFVTRFPFSCALVVLALLQSVTIGRFSFPQNANFDTEPEAIHQELPVYPHEALPHMADGSSWIRVNVGSDGKVTSAKIEISSKLSAFDDAALDAAWMWDFKPAERKGRPISCGFTIPFNFRVPDFAEAKVNVRHQDVEVVPSEVLTSLEFGPTGLLASGGKFGLVELWHADEGHLSSFQSLRGRRVRITAMAFRPDGHLIAAGGEDGSLQSWSISKEWTNETLRETGCAVTDLAMSPDGNLLAAAGCKIELWDLQGGGVIASLGDEVETYGAVGFSPEGTELFAVGQDGAVQVWSVADHDLIRSYDAPEGEVSVVDIHPGKGLAALGFCDDRIEILRLSDGAVADTLSGDGDCVHDIEFLPDGDALVSSTRGWGLRYWNFADDSIERTYLNFGDKVHAMSFNPKGDQLVWVALGDVHLWGVERTE